MPAISQISWPFDIAFQTKFRAKTSFVAFGNVKAQFKLIWDPLKNRPGFVAFGNVKAQFKLIWDPLKNRPRPQCSRSWVMKLFLR